MPCAVGAVSLARELVGGQLLGVVPKGFPIIDISQPVVSVN